MKYTHRNNKKQLQHNKQKTNKYRYKQSNKFTKKKYNKKIKKGGGKEEDYYIKNEYRTYPSSFLSLIKKYRPNLSIEEIIKSMLKNNLKLYNLVKKNNKEIHPKYYGNETEENIVNILLGSSEDNIKNPKKDFIEFNYNGNLPKT